jgi:hypothetical protein
MQGISIDALAERVARLERENRRLKQGGLALTVAAGVALLMGQAAPRNLLVRAQRIVVTDENGNDRIVLGAAKDKAGVQVLSGDGKATAVLAVSQDSAGVSVTDESGRHRVTLGKHLRQGGGAGLWLYDGSGTLRYSVGVDQHLGISIFDEKGKPVP